MRLNKFSISDKVSRLNFIEFVSLLLLFFILFIRFIYIFTYDTDLEGVEFALLHFVQKIVVKGNLYGNAAKFPYLLVVHAPLYYYLMAGLSKLFTINVITDVHNLYILFRSFSFLLLFVNFFLLLKIVNKIVPVFRYKIHLLVLFLLFLPSHFYSCRPDSLKVTLFLSFFYLLLYYYQHKQLKHLIYSAGILSLGILCKQDVLAYGLAAYLLFFIFEKKIVYALASLLVIFLITTCIVLYYSFTGINLIKELFFYNLQYDSDLSLNLMLIIIYYVRAAPLIIVMFINLFSNHKLSKILSCLSILYLFICTAAMLRTGSNINYTYESFFILLLNSVLFIHERENLFKQLLFKHPQIFIILYIVFLFITNHRLFYKSYFLSKTELNFKDEFIQNQQSSVKIKKIISDNVVFIPDMKYYIFYADANLIYGSDWHYDRYCELALDIRISPKFIHNPIIKTYDNQFENGNVQYILTADNYRSKHHVSKYYPYYKKHIKVDNFILYKYQTVK